MGKVLRLPRQAISGLDIPNVCTLKPEEVEIDWDHPMAQWLELAFVQDLELVLGTEGEPIASNSQNTESVAGRAIGSNNNQDGGWAFRDCGIKGALHGKSEFTIVILAAIDSYDNWGALFTTPAYLNSWAAPYHCVSFTRYSNTNRAQNSVARSMGASDRDARVTSGDFFLTDGLPHVYAVTRRSNYCKFFRDGVGIYSTSANTGTIHIEHDNVYLMGRNDSSAGEGVIGTNHIALVFSEWHDNQQSEVLAGDIFQILKPKHQHLIPISAGGPSSRTITASQTEEGDTLSAEFNVVQEVLSSVVEEGDTINASLQANVSITASRIDAGDTIASNIDPYPVITASISETGDTIAADFEVTGAGSTVDADQQEPGDTIVAHFEVQADMSISRIEEGDTISAVVEVPVIVTASIVENGDTLSAVFDEAGTRLITANQIEEGDVLSAVLLNVSSVTASRVDAGDTVNADILVVTPMTEIVIPNITVID